MYAAPTYKRSVTDGHSVTLRMFNREAHDALAGLIARLDAQGAEVGLDQMLVLDALLGQEFIDVGQAGNVLQLPRDDARRILEAMCLPPLGLLERKGHTAAATFHLAKGVAMELKGKAAYTRTRGLNPIRYAEMVREYLRDHQRIENAELRELLGLGNSPSAQVEASRYLKKWSHPDDGFLDRRRAGRTHVYTLRRDAILSSELNNCRSNANWSKMFNKIKRLRLGMLSILLSMGGAPT